MGARRFIEEPTRNEIRYSASMKASFVKPFGLGLPFIGWPLPKLKERPAASCVGVHSKIFSSDASIP
jgi:hypothetical protein